MGDLTEDTVLVGFNPQTEEGESPEIVLLGNDIDAETVHDLSPHAATAITIYSCLVNDDPEFNSLLRDKFEQYGQEFLDERKGSDE